MAYQSKITGEQLENVVKNSLLKTEQALTNDEKSKVKENLGIQDINMTEYATKTYTDEKIGDLTKETTQKLDDLVV